MNYKDLKKELDLIQEKYLKILKELSNLKSKDIALHYVDIINVFWFSKRNIVRLICDSFFYENNTYCLTGVVHFDVSKKDEYGIFAIGDYYIFDDRLIDYLNLGIKISDQIFSNSFQSIIREIIDYNIDLMKEFDGMLYLLPLRYLVDLFNNNRDEMNELADYFTLQFFKNIKDKEDYYRKNSTIDDLVMNLKANASSQILLFEDDNLAIDWETRMNLARKEHSYFDLSNCNEVEFFYMVLYGHIRQALAIIEIEETFNFPVLIKSRLTLHYYTLITNVIEKNMDENCITCKYNYRKSQLAYIIYIEYRKRNFNYSISDFKSKLKLINFEAEVLNIINLKDINAIIKEINDLLNRVEKE